MSTSFQLCHNSVWMCLEVLVSNDMSILLGHFVLCPRERKKIVEIVEEMKEKDRE